MNVYHQVCQLEQSLGPPSIQVMNSLDLFNVFVFKLYRMMIMMIPPQVCAMEQALGPPTTQTMNSLIMVCSCQVYLSTMIMKMKRKKELRQIVK